MGEVRARECSALAQRGRAVGSPGRSPVGAEDGGPRVLQHAMVIDSRNSSILPKRGALLKVNQVACLPLLACALGAGGPGARFPYRTTSSNCKHPSGMAARVPVPLRGPSPVLASGRASDAFWPLPRPYLAVGSVVLRCERFPMTTPGRGCTARPAGAGPGGRAEEGAEAGSGRSSASEELREIGCLYALHRVVEDGRVSFTP